MKLQPLISVCIPVFSTEPYLLQCLRSAYIQDFNSFEILVVSDASRGKDSMGRNARKLVKIAQKECKRFRKENKLQPVEIRFIEHRENRGLIEVRRSLCTQARGFFTTQLDSDDEMEEGALSALYNAAKIQNTNASEPDLQQRQFYDIIHGTSTAGTFDEKGNFLPQEVNRYGTIFYGTIEGREVFRRWIINGDFTANTWGKLIKRELFLKAYENIPYTQCNMADDYLLFFFLSQYAKSYIGIQTKVYRYRVNTGMTSHRSIDSLQKWKMICSAASVFTVISQWVEKQGAGRNQNPSQADNLSPLLPDEIEMLRSRARYYILNNIQQMRDRVVPELLPQARQMLCDYWGEEFVEIAEKALDSK